MPTFKFDKYTMRPAEGEWDLKLVKDWIFSDPWHRGRFEPEWWLEQSATVNSFVLEDDGGPILFFQTRLMSATKVDLFIQFSPKMPGLSFMPRTPHALTVAFAWFAKKLGALKYDSVYFTSKNPQLIEFCERRLGFVVDGVSEQGTRLKAYLEHEGGSNGEAERSSTESAAD